MADSSHSTTKSTGALETPLHNPEQNKSLPIMYDIVTSHDATSCETEGETKPAAKRAPRVGLRTGGRGRQYTWAEKLEARYISKPDEGCWEVSGYQLPRNGYVQISMGGVQHPNHEVKVAHRVAYELTYGPVPEGLVVAHTCDNPRCARPDHLVATTQAENVRDAIRKGRYNTFGIQKLTAAQVLEIRELAARGDTQKSIARRFNISRNTVSGIVNHKSWAHLTKSIDGPRSAVELDLHNVERVRTVQVPVLGEVS